MEVKYSILKKKRKDGRYAAYAYVPGQPRKYVYDKDPQELKRKLFALVDELENGIIDNDVKFAQYSNYFLEMYCKNLSPTTQHEYKRKLDTTLIPVFGDKKMKEIAFTDIQEFMNAFGETHSEKSSKDMLGLLKRMFNCAIQYDKIRKENPCNGVRVKATEPYEYDVYTIEEMQAFLKAIEGTKYEVPIILASLCGLRLSEVCGLKWKDVDFDNFTITVRRAAVTVGNEVIIKPPKTKTSHRTILMPVLVANILKKYRGMPEAFVCPGENGGPDKGVLLSTRIRKFRQRIGFPHTRFHDLRHFTATAMLEGGVPDKQTAAVLGHSDIAMTKKYQHILKSVVNRPAKLMDNLFAPGTNEDKSNDTVSKPVSNDKS